MAFFRVVKLDSDFVPTTAILPVRLQQRTGFEIGAERHARFVSRSLSGCLLAGVLRSSVLIYLNVSHNVINIKPARKALSLPLAALPAPVKTHQPG
jgi:hypothetical protein